MLTKEAYLNTHPDISTGMDVYSLDGEKLGHVERLDEDSITIEKGLFFPKDFLLRYDDVVDIRDDNLIVRPSRADLEAWRDANYEGWQEYERAERETTKRPGRREETRMPLHEEELEAETQQREGEVRLHKVVHTETRHMTIPVRKEEVVVERGPATKSSGRDTGKKFEKEEVKIPIVEEEVEVRKRPVVKEEVTARKESRTEERKVSGEVRKEDVEVHRDEPKSGKKK